MSGHVRSDPLRTLASQPTAFLRPPLLPKEFRLSSPWGALRMFTSLGAHRRAIAHWAMELLVVAAGVLIALSAQQWAEGRSSQRSAAAAEEAMALEIENSLLASAELVRLDRCWEVQFLALQQAIVSGDRLSAGRIVGGSSIFGSGRLWADNAFQATLTAQVSDRLGSEKLKRYSQVYDMIRKARVAQEERQQAVAQLGTLTIAGLPSSPDITYSLLTALARLQASKTTMQNLGELIIMFAKKDLGLEVTPAQYLAARGRVDNINRCEGQALLAQQSTR